VGVVTASVAGGRDYRELSGPAKPLPKVNTRAVRGGRLFGARASQLVGTQVAAAALLVGTINGTIGLAAGAIVAIVVLAFTWLRWRGRWIFEWLGVAFRFGRRPRTAGTGAGSLLSFVAPTARVEQTELAGDPAAVIVDGLGLVSVLELGDPAGLLAEETPMLPSPASLLPAAAPDQPPVLIQLLLTGAPSPAVRAGAGTPANSYRQLTEGRLLGHTRALLSVRVLRTEGWSEEELLRALTGLARKLVRRLSTVPARPLGEAAAVRVLSEIAHDDGAAPAQEFWPGVKVGGLAQATYRLHRWPDLQIETSRRMVSRMLTLPAAATTVSFTAGPRPAHGPTPVDLTVRLAAPDTAALGAAAQALRKVVSAEHAHVRRLDGEHLLGLAATLPLGGSPSAVPGLPLDGVHPAERAEGMHLPVSAGGLMLGSNRHGKPVVIRLFRPEQTRALLVGGVRAAQLIALRAMALGARVVVQTARPQSWEPFVRGAAVPGESIAVVPPGRSFEIAPGSALHPLLVVVDVGPVGADNRPGSSWQATLVVRDEFTQVDVDVAARADLLVLQPLRPAEATLVGTALGLGEVAQWMTKIRPDMVGVVNRRAVRWAALAQTPIESQLIGPPTR
jgi:type VII secretion protein EccE